MATGKIVGQIEVSEGNIKILGVDGVVREPGFEGYLYENEQVISEDPTALFQIKFLALPEASAYTGVFRILADGSVIHGRDAMESIASDESLVEILETAEVKEDSEDLETAAGEEEAEGSTAFTETDIVADSSVLGFNRGENSELGFGITEYGSEDSTNGVALPAITSPNNTIFDENDTDPVMQVKASGASAIEYSISGLDSDLFDINPLTGLLTFKDSPDYENPKDFNEDNEYNMYVTATDSFGNYTTQLLSVFVNNVNEPVTAYDDTVDAIEDIVLNSTINLNENDYDVDGDDLTVEAGTYTTAQGGTIVIAEDGSYTYTPKTNFNGTDSVNYTVTDGEFSDVGTLTINVVPANDAPVITDGPDIDSLNETNAALIATGTMTVSDVDTTDNVTASVDGIVVTGTSDRTDAAAPTDAQLKAMFSVTPTDIIDGTENSDTLTWNFNSGSEAFDYLAAGETLILTYTVKATDDAGTPLSDTETVTITITGTNDKPTIESNTIYATEDIDYTITLADFIGFDDIDGDEMSAIRIDTLPSNGVLNLDGDPVAVGDEISVVDINSGLLYLTTPNNGSDTSFTFSASDGTDWSSSQTMNIDITPVTDTVKTDTLSVIMDVLPPVIDTSTLTMSDDINTASNIFETADGLKLTGPVGTVVQVNTEGNGLGIDSNSGSGDARDIDGALTEWLQIEFPTSTTLNTINIDIKHASDDVMTIQLYDASAAAITSGITYQIDGKGTVYILGSDGLIDGSLLSGNAAHTITISSTTAFAKMLISDDDSGASAGTDGFSVLNVYGTVSSTPDSYDSVIHLNGLGLGDTDGSEEISTITLSGFPAGSTITLSDGVTEIEADGYGNWVIDAADLGLSSTLTDLNDVEMTLTSPIAISSTFVPTVDIVTTEIGAGVPDSHTILGGTADDVLTGEEGNDYIDGGAGDDIIIGGEGNDYIDGGAGDDTIDGGAGNDTIEYDTLDTLIDAGDGSDALIGNAETINLANVDNIEVIQLSSGATVIGSGDANAINPSDVMDATDGNNTLVIESSDEGAYTINVDTTLLQFSENVDGYNIYTDDTVTLKIEDSIIVE
ncbi:Ig-like domain-containing protein [Sulfurimonas xiamenensis]|uniref:Cadherin domain-containing protein n=1 Tax=Sulfurimonas xiamenensis TaxID=2590021 RepID=A0AAJ4A3D9_9BACT|nr:Ig-like domain-containing protein [Sulfurimonas xiamenensis]QFR43140.1 hypothetical protein FJR47_04170 [Sulfurimonas xiamenensis]